MKTREEPLTKRYRDLAGRQEAEVQPLRGKGLGRGRVGCAGRSHRY